MASSSSYWQYDVFMNFCGDDVRTSFISFLGHVFNINAITMFHGQGIERSQVITPALTQAIRESRISIVVFTMNYPSSSWCLDVLLEILKCRQCAGQIVMTVFYGVDPSDVQKQTGNFGSAFRKTCAGRTEEERRNWSRALTSVGNIAGEDTQNCPNEVYLMEKIAADVSDKLNELRRCNGLVAMDRHKKVLCDFLALEVNKEVRTIGIWGNVGVGKTTLARYIYPEVSVNFQTHAFLENIENMKDKILKFEEDEDTMVTISLDRNEHEITEARRKHRKVLLIADDVNNIEQGKWIIEYANQFAPGSRVILINQNKNLLVDAGVMDVYEVTSLRYDEALELFSHYAFKQPYPPSDFEQLAVRAVHHAGFLPLSLRLLGSLLTGRDREEWVAALLKFKKKPGKSIMEVWKLMEATQDKGQEERDVDIAEEEEDEDKK